MSDLIAARPDEELRDLYEKEKSESPDDTTDSELVRTLLKDALRHRGEGLYDRVGFTNRIAAQLENERATGEREKDVLRDVVEDGLRTRRSDVLEAIDASEELRKQVEDVREEGENLDETVRRLMREGINAQGENELKTRLIGVVSVFVISGYPAFVAYNGQPITAAILIVMFAGLILFQPWADTALDSLPTPLTWLRERW